MNLIDMNLINTPAIPMYRGFQFTICNDVATLGLHCIAYKHPYYLEAVDDHGVLRKNLKEAETIEFNITHDELHSTDETTDEVIMRRFIAEVDYYLKQNLIIPMDPDKSSYLKRYKCNHCGTSAILSAIGYTPACRNCGALMQVEE